MLRTLSFLLLCTPLLSQSNTSLAARLGYPEDTKLLIIHADDLGVAHAENTASLEVLEQGVVTSGSVMAPCPWLPEVAAYARQHPQHDLGLHLTLTSEWNPYKWGPVAPLCEVASLTDSLGYFFNNCEEMAKRAQPDAVYKELKAQVLRAKAMGLHPTHLDTHMGCLIFQRAAFFKIYIELGREFGIPVMLSEDMRALPDSFAQCISDRDVVVRKVIGAGPEDFKNGMEAFYTAQLERLEPGVSVMLVHIAADTDEMRGMTADYSQYPNWCAPWRKADFDFFTSEKCKKLIEQHHIQLLTWRQIGQLTAPK